MNARLPVAALVAAFSFLAPARADDVTGKDPILCAIVEVNFCTTVDSCEQGPPWFWNVPDFLAIDFGGNRDGGVEVRWGAGGPWRIALPGSPRRETGRGG